MGTLKLKVQGSAQGPVVVTSRDGGAWASARGFTRFARAVAARTRLAAAERDVVPPGERAAPRR